jgi:hypothetical protein
MSASDAAQTVDSGRRPVRRRSIATAILVGSAIGLAAAMFLIVAVGPRDGVEDFAGPSRRPPTPYGRLGPAPPPTSR